jgi:twitching motility two-component system response regulator PilH
MDVRTATTTALLVDDDVVSYQTRQKQLEDDGYTVTVARSGPDGLSRARQSAPNVIFSHLVAGGQDNVAFIQALRSDDACRHISVIVMTDRPSSGRGRQLRRVSRDRW